MTGGAGRALRNLALLAHAGLAASVALTLARIDSPPWLGAGLAITALIPLAATLPGLVACRPGALRWLALALVLYAGLGSVEVIATATAAAAVLLFCALLELGLVLMLSRRPGPRAHGAAGES